MAWADLGGMIHVGVFAENASESKFGKKGIRVLEAIPTYGIADEIGLNFRSCGRVVRVVDRRCGVSDLRLYRDRYARRLDHDGDRLANRFFDRDGHRGDRHVRGGFRVRLDRLPKLFS